MSDTPDRPQPPPTEQWQRRLTEMLAAVDELDTTERRGRVLSVKPGFNPNSSSVGSVVSVLFWTATAGSVALTAFDAFLRARRKKQADEPSDE